MEHNHSHSHHHKPPASLKNLAFAILINGGIVVFEMVFGLMIGSMALISDGVHKYRINHTTLQILPASVEPMAHCEHCN